MTRSLKLASFSFLVAIAAMIAFPSMALAAAPSATDNINEHVYWRWASPAASYLYTAGDGSLHRVEFRAGELEVESV